MPSILETDIKGCYVKLVVKNKNNPYLFDQYIEKLESNEPLEMNIIEDVQDVFNEEMMDIDESEDTLTIIHKAIDNTINPEFDSNRIKKIMNDLIQHQNCIAS